MPPMVGQITLFPYDFDPVDWMSCDGRMLPISDNETLFQLLEFSFGGDGEYTFGLPNIQAPPNCRYCIATKGGFQSFTERILGDLILAALPVSAPNLIECKGQVLPVNQNPFLYQYLGNRFGGDNVRFNLPDLRSKAPSHCHYLLSPRGQGSPEHPSNNWYVGEIVLLPFEVQSDRLVLCNGRMLSTQNSALYQLLRNRFGGNNQQFAVPDLRALAPPNCNYYITLEGAFPSRG